MLSNLFKNQVFLVLLLAAATLLLYANTFNSPFALDDYHNILANKPIRVTELTFASLKNTAQNSLIKNRPVANISLALNYYFHQYDVTGYHVVNTVIHMINAILLYLFIQYTLQLLPRPASRLEINWIAFSAALLWLVHPLQTQSVTYIIQRMNSLASLFYLLSFIFYIRARISKKTIIRIIFAFGSLSAGLLAIGSKENGVMLPLFIILYEWYFFQDLRIHFKKQHYAALFLVLLFLAGAVFFYLGPNPLKIISSYSGRDFTLQERLFTQLRVVLLYVSLVFFPLPSRLTLEHDFAISHSMTDPLTTLFSGIMLLGLLTSAVFSAKRHRLLSFCLLWFCGNLLIESSIIPLEIIFEHRTYLPSMMLILLPVMFAHNILANNTFKTLLLVAAVVLLAFWTHERNSIWDNEISLWSDIAQKAPNKPRAQMNLGIILSKEGRMEEAMVYLNRAVKLDPGYDLSHYSLGDALMKQGKYIEASESYSRALQIKPQNSLARFNLGKSLAAAGKHQNAVYHYQLAAGKDQFISHQVYYFMGNSLYQLGRYSEAIEAYTKALREKPDYTDAYKALINTRKIMEILQKNQPVKTP